MIARCACTAAGGGGGKAGHTFFWLAQVQRKSRVDAADGGSAVPCFRAEASLSRGGGVLWGVWGLDIRAQGGGGSVAVGSGCG
jgi:hypothetical protein